MGLLETIKKLCREPGISGRESGAAKTALEYLKQYTPDAEMDEFQNVYGEVYPTEKGQKTVLLDAHIDAVGFIVTHIDLNGFLKVASCGGIDRRLLLGQEVTVYGKEELHGVIAAMPPHLTGSSEMKVPEVENILIDIGLNKEQAEKLVQPGDNVSICSAFHKLLGSRIASRALDDRSGVAVILHALELLKGKKLSCGLSVLFSAQEETGERGATIAGYNINPNIGIAVDVSFAHTPDVSEYKCGKLGKGVMIGIAPSLDKQISDTFLTLAQQKNIPYQTEVMGSTTGTNADTIGIQRGGTRTGLLSIPLKYMHTPNEVIDLDDCENTAKLLASYLEQEGKE